MPAGSHPPGRDRAARRSGSGVASGTVFTSGSVSGGIQPPTAARPAAAASAPVASGRPPASPRPPAAGRPPLAPRPPAATGPPPASRPPAATKKRRGDPFWAKVLVIAGALLMLLSGTAIAGVTVLLDRYTGSVNQQNLLGSEAIATGNSINGALTVLMAGIDERPGPNPEGARADSIILLHVTANHDAAYMVSIPRDSRVAIPPFSKSHYPGGTDKINAAFFFGSQNGGGRAGGFELLALTIKKMSGISFNAGAIVNFAGFQAVTTALGGVHMCVDETTTSIHIGHDSRGNFAAPYRMTSDLRPIPVPGVKPQVYLPGCYDMTDWQALDFVRQRELIPDGDYGRQRHQQQFVKALGKKTMSAGVVANPKKLDAVLRAAGGALTVDAGHSSLSDWLFTLKDLNPANLTMIKTNAGNFHSEIVGGQAFETLDPTSQQLFRSIRDDNVAYFISQHPDWVNADGTQAAGG